MQTLLLLFLTGTLVSSPSRPASYLWLFAGAAWAQSCVPAPALTQPRWNIPTPSPGAADFWVLIRGRFQCPLESSHLWSSHTHAPQPDLERGLPTLWRVLPVPCGCSHHVVLLSLAVQGARSSVTGSGFHGTIMPALWAAAHPA